MCFSCIRLFVLYVLVLVIFFFFLLVSSVDAVYDCGTPWTFQVNSLRAYLSSFKVTTDISNDNSCKTK